MRVQKIMFRFSRERLTALCITIHGSEISPRLVSSISVSVQEPQKHSNNMPTVYEEIKEHLKGSPKARERKNKNRFIAWLVIKKYPVFTLEDIDTITHAVGDSLTFDRAWRQVLQHEPSLRGTDYEDKKILEQEKEIELGYTPGMASDVKKLKTL